MASSASRRWPTSSLTSMSSPADGRSRRPQERQAFGDDLLRRGVESRIVSMETELPLELVLTHTRTEVGAAVDSAAHR